MKPKLFLSKVYSRINFPVNGRRCLFCNLLGKYELRKWNWHLEIQCEPGGLCFPVVMWVTHTHVLSESVIPVCAVCLTGRLTDAHLPFSLFSLLDKFFSFSSERASSHAAERTELLRLWTYGATPLPPPPPPPQKKVNIAECLILCTRGDYVPFCIRYALVKWVLEAFICRGHTCADTHTHTHTRTCLHHVMQAVMCSTDSWVDDKCASSLLFEFHPHENKQISH